MKKNLFIILLGLFLLSSCSNNRKLPNIGENCELNQECLSAIDEDSFNELNKVCVRKDESRLKEMIFMGIVYVLKPFYECKMMDTQFAKSKILVKDPTGDEYEVWVSNEFLKKIE
nr:MAG TPA: protein of unknown function (DUF4969) [Caudoviricetes sp.]